MCNQVGKPEHLISRGDVYLISFDNRTIVFEPRCEKRSSGCPIRSDTNESVQPQKMARGLKFRI